MSAETKQGFPPIIDDKSRILILGTMPGEESLKRKEYYANPRNQFWPILARIYKAEVGITFEERKQFILRHHLALWDVLEYCERKGSLDQAIKAAEPNDFSHLFKNHPQLKLIAFNGQKAAEWFDRKVVKKQTLPQPTHVRRIILPSTSSAAAIALATKINKWRQIVVTEQIK